MRQWVNGLVLSGCLFGISPALLAEPLDLSTLLPPDEKAAEPAAENADGSPAPPQNEVMSPSTEGSTAVPPPATEPSMVETPIPPDQPGILKMPAPRTSTINMPGRGMKKTDVEARFGAPREKTDPVGKPPISSWVYPDFTVYFEHDTALHSVTNNP